MDTHAHTALPHPYLSNVEKTTFHHRAQNFQIYQKNAASVKGRIQPTTRDAQYIKQFPGNTSSKKAQQSPLPNFNINTNPEYHEQQPGPKTHPGHVHMKM